MATLNFDVENNDFSPPSRTGSPGDTIKFQNKRSSEVTVNLQANFYNPNQLQIGANSSKSAEIVGTSGTGQFTAPKGGSSDKRAEQENSTIKGEVVIPSK